MSNVKPNHYQLDVEPYESIDIIRAVLGDKVKYFYIGSILKYITRAEKKNGLEDYKKAEAYLKWLIEWDNLSYNEKEIRGLEVQVDELERRIIGLDEFKSTLKEIKKLQEKITALKKKDISGEDIFDIRVRLEQLEYQLEEG